MFQLRGYVVNYFGSSEQNKRSFSAIIGCFRQLYIPWNCQFIINNRFCFVNILVLLKYCNIINYRLYTKFLFKSEKTKVTLNFYCIKFQKFINNSHKGCYYCAFIRNFYINVFIYKNIYYKYVLLVGFRSTTHCIKIFDIICPL